MKKLTLVLDAMGVIYESGDDVADLLTPFVMENGGTVDSGAVHREYTEASLGRISAARFWANVAVRADLEDPYLARHRLAPDLMPFLQNIPEAVESVWCLSNDVSEWSLKLREQHGLAGRFAGFVVSGDVGVRKPSAGIYEIFLREAGRNPWDCVLVDDRPQNLDAARRLGFQTVLFARSPDGNSSSHEIVTSFGDLGSYLTGRGK